jgi:hypothetical protein
MPNIQMSKLLGWGPVALAIMCVALVLNYLIVFGVHSKEASQVGLALIFKIMLLVQVPMILAYFFMDLNEEYKVKRKMLFLQIGAFMVCAVAASFVS